MLTDGKGNPSRFTLDSLGQIISQTDALGHTTTTQRDTNGNPIKITRPNGAVTTMTYDAKGNLLTSTDPIGATTMFTYEPNFNQVKTIRDPKGNTTTINYDEKGNPIEIIDALGNRTPDDLRYPRPGNLYYICGWNSDSNHDNFYLRQQGQSRHDDRIPRATLLHLAYDNAGNVLRSTDAGEQSRRSLFMIR